MTDTSGQRDENLESIDKIDARLLDLFEQRLELVQQSPRDSLMQGSLIRRVAQANRRIAELVANHSTPSSLIDSESKSALLRHLSSVCLQSLHQFRVAFLGPKYSYSHLAVMKYFGDAIPVATVGTIPAVFDCVKRGDCATGVVPIENNTDGRVVDTLGTFLSGGIEICGEVLLPIHHNLMSKTSRDEITEVHSKPQALSQCRTWLAKNLPRARLVETNSTAGAAELASTKPGVAAVASLQAGRQYELDVIDVNIEDNPNNVTRFAVLGNDRQLPTGDDKTSILFQLDHQPGTLADAMMIFKSHALNLTWIESFPSPEAANEYFFFVELTGHRDDEPVVQAVDELTAQTKQLTILGSYPRAKL